MCSLRFSVHRYYASGKASDELECRKHWSAVVSAALGEGYVAVAESSLLQMRLYVYVAADALGEDGVEGADPTTHSVSTGAMNGRVANKARGAIYGP